MNSKQKREAKKAAAALAAKNVNVETPKAVEAPKEEKKEKKVKDPKTPKSDETLTKANAAAVTKRITDKKDLKYIYPEDCDDLAGRKKFRAEVRRKMGAFEKQIAKLQASELKEDVKLLKAVTKEARAYEKQHYQTTPTI